MRVSGYRWDGEGSRAGCASVGMEALDSVGRRCQFSARGTSRVPLAAPTAQWQCSAMRIREVIV